MEWIASRDRSAFFSFENVCATLDLDPDEVRADVWHWRDVERSQPAIERHVTRSLFASSGGSYDTRHGAAA